jgi:hypothetical protein
MKTSLEELIEHIDNAIDNNNMVGSIIYPDVNTALLDIKRKAEELMQVDKIFTDYYRSEKIKFVRWITENYEFVELIIPYEVVDAYEESKT